MEKKNIPVSIDGQEYSFNMIHSVIPPLGKVIRITIEKKVLLLDDHFKPFLISIPDSWVPPLIQKVQEIINTTGS
jgi:hypothetical protein